MEKCDDLRKKKTENEMCSFFDCRGARLESSNLFVGIKYRTYSIHDRIESTGSLMETIAKIPKPLHTDCEVYRRVSSSLLRLNLDRTSRSEMSLYLPKASC